MKRIPPSGRPYWPPGTIVVGLLCFFLADISRGIQAQESIDLAWALRQTLEKNQELRAYPFVQRRSDALKRQADIRPLPNLGFEVENAFGSGDFGGLDQSEITLVLSQVFELGGKREQRVGVADAGIQRIQTEYDLTRLDVLAETSRRYYQLLRIQSLQDLIVARIQEEQQALGVIRSRATAGAVGQADVSRMALRLARSLALQEQLGDARLLAGVRLAAMWNGAAGFSSARGDLGAIPGLPAGEDLLTFIEESPAMTNQLALLRLADANVRLAQSNGKSNTEFGIGVRQLNLTDDQALVFTFRMPLAFRNPNIGRIEAARADMDWSREKTGLLRRQLELALVEIHQIMVSYRNQAGRIEQDLLPQAESLLNDTQAGYESGRYSVLQWLDAQKELYNLEVELIEARSQVFLQLLELERITGQAMTGTRNGEMS